MADLHELIERAQVTLASSMNPDKAELREIHEELCDEIRHANKRLRECDALLASGHRSEAVQLAETEPNLLDVVAVLDFPEFPEWNDFVAELGLTVAPELQIDIASDLNQAYSEDAPLEGHLRRLRVYSLARAPLRKRIDLVRQIAKLDVGNPIWDDDIKAYETTRLRQIKDEFRDASRKNNAEKLYELSEELHDKRWMVSPSRQLVEQIDRATQSIDSEQAVEQLREVADDIRTAYNDNDLNSAIALVDEWKQLATECDQSSDEFHRLREVIAPALRWINQQEASQKAERQHVDKVKRFQRSLQSAQSAAELTKRYDSLMRDAEFDLPDDVQEQHDRKVAELERKRRTVQMGIVGGAVAAVVVVASIVLWFQRVQDVEQKAVVLEQYIQDGDFDSADEMIEDLKSRDPDILYKGRFPDLMRDFKEKKSRIENRQQSFDDAVNEARELIDAPRNLASFDRALEAVARAKENRSVEDGTTLMVLEERIVEKRREYETSVNEAFAAAAGVIETDAGKLLNNPATTLEELDQLRVRLNALANTEDIPSDKLAPVKRLLGRVDEESETRSRTQQDEKALAAVTTAVGNGTSYELRLTEYARRVGVDVESGSLLRDDRDFAVVIEGWNEFNDRIAGSEPAQLADQAVDLVNIFDSLVDDAPHLSVPDSYDQLMQILRRITQRDDEQLEDELRRVLANPAIAGLKMMQDSENKVRYYFADEPVDAGDQWMVNIFRSADLNESEAVALDKAQVTDDSETEWLSPQSRFSREATALLDGRNELTWEETYCQLLDRLVSADYDRLDPVLRLRLYDLIVTTARSGSLFLQAGLESHESAVSDGDIDLTVNWCDPATQESYDVAAIDRLLSELREPGTDSAAFVKQRDTVIEEKPFLAWQWCGWLCRNRERKWSIRINSEADPVAGSLYVLVPGNETTSAQMVEIGTNTANGPQLKQSRRGYFVAGQRVYLQVTESS